MVNAGAVPLPVQLQIGDGDPIEVGHLVVDMGFDPDTGALTAPTLPTKLAELLAEFATKLRREVVLDVAPDPR